MAAVKAAFDAGVNLFDTSPYYGDTRSEAVRDSGGGGCPCLLKQQLSAARGVLMNPAVLAAAAQVLGRGLALLPRDQIVVATKVGRYGSGTFDFRWGCRALAGRAAATAAGGSAGTARLLAELLAGLPLAPDTPAHARRL